MGSSEWRLNARQIMVPILAQALADNWPVQTLGRAIHRSYPWGRRTNHPYSCWLKERSICLRAFVNGVTIAAQISADTFTSRRPKYKANDQQGMMALEATHE